MNRPTEFFIDGLGDVRLHAGMLRIDFVVHEADPQQPGAQHRAARLIMTPHALLKVVQGLAQAASQLTQGAAAGPLPMSETTEPTEPQATAQPSRLAPDVPGRSPNFGAP